MRRLQLKVRLCECVLCVSVCPYTMSLSVVFFSSVAVVWGSAGVSGCTLLLSGSETSLADG